MLIMKKLLPLLVICALSAFSASTLSAADKKPEKEEKAKAKAQHIPFHGEMADINKTAKTFKVGERTFHVTAETKVMKAGKPATFDDAKAGEDCGGTYKEATGGKLEVLSLRLGAKPEKKPKKKEDK